LPDDILLEILERLGCARAAAHTGLLVRRSWRRGEARRLAAGESDRLRCWGGGETGSGGSIRRQCEREKREDSSGSHR
jgi:hypothetical protein